MSQKRAAIWARVSTDKQEDGTSLETQLDECRRLCTERGWDVVAEYRVIHSIEYIDDIPEWQQLQATLRRKEIDVLVALKFDRITGHPADLLSVVRKCERYDAEIALVQDEIPRGEYGDVIMYMEGLSGYRRRQTIIEASGRGQRAKMRGQLENGVPPRPLGSQWAPFGLRWVEEYETKRGITRPMKRRFEVDPDKVEILRSIFRWYDEGESLRGLCKRLRDAGVHPPGFRSTGNPNWRAVTLRRILTNENYIGVGYAGTRDGSKGATSKHKPRDQWIRLPDDTFPKIVDETLFARVRERLEQNKTECAPGNRNPEVGLLRRGLGVCGYCGFSLNIVLHRGDSYYRCAPENRDRFGCPSHQMSVNRLDDAVWRFVVHLFRRPGALEAKLFGEPPRDPTIATLPAAEAELKRLAQERDRVHRRLRATDDDVLAAAYEDDLRTILAEVRAAEARCHALMTEHEAWKIAQEQRNRVLDEAARLREELDGLDWHGQRNVLMRIRAKIELFSERDADPRWRVTTGFVVGRFYSQSSNIPLMPSPFGCSAPLTIVFGDEEDAKEPVNVLHRSAPAPSRPPSSTVAALARAGSAVASGMPPRA